MKKTLIIPLLAMLAVPSFVMAQKTSTPAEVQTTQAAPSGQDVYTVVLPAKDNMDAISFNMILAKNGRFVMGATSEQRGADKDETPYHTVLISKDYYIGETEVPQILWEYIMGNNPSSVKGENMPVESISWEDAQRFCERLSALTNLTFRLPTEAEWEYAARGAQNQGSSHMFAGSDMPDEVGWYMNNAHANLKEIKGKKPNELGLYDMSGNVFEFCQDSKEKYNDKQVTDPMVNSGPNTDKVRRGGSCKSDATQLRVSFRRRVAYNEKQGIHPGGDDTGLRLVMETK